MKRILSIAIALVMVLSIVSSASALVLKAGSTGSAVKEVQSALTSQGYGDIKADGKYGASTVAAVKRFQKANNLVEDGKAGNRTLMKLLGHIPDNNPSGSDDILTIGSVGDQVRSLQSGLKSLGYPVGKVDGTFGKNTQSAVKAFQSLNNLTVDGKAGKKTIAVLESGSAAPYSKTETYTTLRKGSTGSAVTKLQKALATLGYYTNSITGYYNNATVDAVADFQDAYGLIQDGVAGPKTQAALYGAI